MSQLTKTAFNAQYNSSGSGAFLDNTSQEITASDMRAFAADIKDSTKFIIGDLGIFYGLASGTNTYTSSITGITSYSTGLTLAIQFTNGSTGASTLNINSLGAITLKLINGDPIISGSILANGIYLISYDGTDFKITGGGGGGSGFWALTGTSNLTGSATIDGGTSKDITFDNLNAFNVNTALGVDFTTPLNEFQLASTFIGVAIGSGDFTVNDSKGTPTGIVYGGAGYVTNTHSLTDKAYVDAGLALYVPLAGGVTVTGNITFATNKGIDSPGVLNVGATNATTVNLGTGSGNTNINIGTSGTNTIQIGNSASTVNILGTVLYENVTNLQVADKLITVNKGGASSSATGTGIEFEEGGSITGYIKTTGGRDGFLLRSPGNSADSSFLLTATSARSYTFQDASSTVAMYSNKLSVFAATSSSELAGVISDETGNGALVFAGSPAFTGTPTLGTLGYSDTGILWSWQSSTNSYNQIIVQNTSNGAAASANLILSNDGGTSTTNFLEIGINSSGFTGSGSFNIASASYLDAASGDLVIGTLANKTLHFVTNGSTTDAMSITGGGLFTITAPIKANTVGGSVTATANSDYHWDFNATVTGRASQTADYVYGTKVDNTLKLGSNTQKLFNLWSTVVNYANNGFSSPLGGAGLFTGVVYINASGSPVINGRAGIESATTASPANGWVDIQDVYPAVQFTSNGNASDRWMIFTGVQTLSAGGGATDFSFRCNSAGASGAGDLFSLSKTGFYGFGNNSINVTLTISSKIIQYRHKYTAPSTISTTTDYIEFSGQTYTFGGTSQTYNHINFNSTIAVGSNTSAVITGFTHNPSVTASVGYTNYAFRAQTGSLSGFGTLTPTASIEIEAGITTRAPLKFTSSGTGTAGLLTSAVAGAIEFTTYGFWGTTTTPTRHKIWHGLVGASAPSTSALTAFVNYYGTGGTVALSTPNTWFTIVGDDGNTYKVPGYS